MNKLFRIEKKTKHTGTYVYREQKKKIFKRENKYFRLETSH